MVMHYQKLILPEDQEMLKPLNVSDTSDLKLITTSLAFVCIKLVVGRVQVVPKIVFPLLSVIYKSDQIGNK